MQKGALRIYGNGIVILQPCQVTEYHFPQRHGKVWRATKVLVQDSRTFKYGQQQLTVSSAVSQVNQP